METIVNSLRGDIMPLFTDETIVNGLRGDIMPPFTDGDYRKWSKG